MRFLKFAIGIFLISGIAAAQSASAAAPFTVTAQRSETAVSPKGGHALDITLQNVGTKPAVGYVLWVEFSDPSTGKRVSATASQLMKLEETANRAQLLAVGQQWRHPRQVFVATGPDGRELNYNVSLDYVVFADGSAWGPDRSGHGKQIFSYLQGFRAASKYYAAKRENGKIPDPMH